MMWIIVPVSCVHIPPQHTSSLPYLLYTAIKDQPLRHIIGNFTAYQVLGLVTINMYLL